MIWEEFLRPECDVTPLGETPFDQYRKHIEKEMGGRYGEQNLFTFPNGLMVSVIKHLYSYGYNHDLFKIAVCRDEKFVTKKYFDSDDDVIGYLSERDVVDCLERVSKL